MADWQRQFAENKITISPQDVNLPDAPKSLQSSQIETALMTVYMVAGIVSVIIIVLGGIRYTSSNGDPSSIKAAKDTILYAVVGLVVAIFAFAIVNFVVGRLS